MKKLLNQMSLAKLSLAFLVLVFLLLILVGIINPRSQPNLISATVVRPLELINDGGFYYQNVEAKLADGNTSFIRIQVRDPKLEEIRSGDQIYVRKLDSAVGDVYTFSGHRRSQVLLYITIIFLILVFIILGKEGIKYISASLLVVLLIATGSFSLALNSINIYLAALIIILLIGFISILLQVRNIKLAMAVNFSQLITIIVILLLNLILFKVTFLTELFYTNLNFLESNMTVNEFWAMINAAIIFVSFGATTNTTQDVASSILRKKKTYPTTSTVNLIREGTTHNQIAIARAINSLFFVFLGISLVNILVGSSSRYFYFWEDPFIVQSLLLFINSAIAALLIGPVTAVITSVLLNASTKEQIQLN